MVKKIKVVWLCHFSNAFVHEKLDLHYNRMIGLVKRIAHKPVSTKVSEFSNWISNGIHEFEKFDDVELHIISPYPNLKERVQEFEDNGICYHFFRSEDDDFDVFMYKKLFHPTNYSYKRNCKVISHLIKRINPVIVHLFGAENPHYALGVLGINDNIIIIAQLQTLMNDPAFKDNYPISNSEYYYRAAVEHRIIMKANFIGTTVKKYRQIIQKDIKPTAIILNTLLVLNEPVTKIHCDKQFDFVYFSANINKAADLAFEAFGIAFQHSPNITMDVIGAYDTETMQSLEIIMSKYGIKHAITFEGRLPSHDDVLKQIRKSRFALLPLKIDITSGTIREAMSNGLPVVTTDTGELGTQTLNVKRQNVLISTIGDHNALAANMLRILEDDVLANTLRENSYQTRIEEKSNEVIAKRYVDAYRCCLDCTRDNLPLPKEITEV